MVDTYKPTYNTFQFNIKYIHFFISVSFTYTVSIHNYGSEPGQTIKWDYNSY